MAANITALWRKLNPRQRAYLLKVHELDADLTQQERGAWLRGERARPATDSRWLEYSAHPLAGESELRRRLRDLGLVDPGTGATFNALERHGLIACRVQPAGPRRSPALFVRLLPLGRQVAQMAAADQPAPSGVLREWHWRALALAYASRPDGLHSAEPGGFGGISRRTWDDLENAPGGALVATTYSLGEYPRYQSAYRLRVTVAGAAFYRREYARYQALYPGVEAPEPDTPHGSAQS